MLFDLADNSADGTIWPATDMSAAVQTVVVSPSLGAIGSSYVCVGDARGVLRVYDTMSLVDPPGSGGRSGRRR